MELSNHQFKKLIKNYVLKTNKRLRPYFLKIKLQRYHFIRKEKYIFGIYVPHSLYRANVIHISLNHKGIIKNYKDQNMTYKEAIRTTIYHELAHGIITYLDYNFSPKVEEGIAENFAWDWETNNLNNNWLFKRLKRNTVKWRKLINKK